VPVHFGAEPDGIAGPNMTVCPTPPKDDRTLPSLTTEPKCIPNGTIVLSPQNPTHDYYCIADDNISVLYNTNSTSSVTVLTGCSDLSVIQKYMWCGVVHICLDRGPHSVHIRVSAMVNGVVTGTDTWVLDTMPMIRPKFWVVGNTINTCDSSPSNAITVFFHYIDGYDGRHMLQWVESGTTTAFTFSTTARAVAMFGSVFAQSAVDYTAYSVTHGAFPDYMDSSQTGRLIVAIGEFNNNVADGSFDVNEFNSKISIWYTDDDTTNTKTWDNPISDVPTPVASWENAVMGVSLVDTASMMVPGLQHNPVVDTAYFVTIATRDRYLYTGIVRNSSAEYHQNPMVVMPKCPSPCTTRIETIGNLVGIAHGTVYRRLLNVNAMVLSDIENYTDTSCDSNVPEPLFACPEIVSDTCDNITYADCVTLGAAISEPCPEVCRVCDPSIIQPADVQYVSLGGPPAYTERYFSAVPDDAVLVGSAENAATGDLVFVFSGSGSLYFAAITGVCNQTIGDVIDHVRLSALFPGYNDPSDITDTAETNITRSWCATADASGFDDPPPSPFLPSPSTTPLTPFQLDDGTDIEVPVIHYRRTVFRGYNLTFCDIHPIPPALARDIAHLPYMQSFVGRFNNTIQNNIRVIGNGMYCPTMFDQRPDPGPAAVMLAAFNVRRVYDQVHMCVPVQDDVDPSLLPYMMVSRHNISRTNVVGVNGASIPLFLRATPPPTPPPTCDLTTHTRYLKNGATCTKATACTVGTTYETSPINIDQDRQCAPVTPIHIGVSYEATAPTYSSDRVTKLVTQCPANHHVTVGPTTTSDAVCRPIASVCHHGYYINTSANANAAPNESVTTDQCVRCDVGTTT
jgi:hypothetical protein